MNRVWVVIAFFLGWAATAGAVAAEVERDNSGMVEEVIVSATFRDTKLMDTPIAISALTEEMLIDKGVVNVQSLYQSIPGLSYRTNSNTYNNVSVRGLTSPGGGGSVVGIYIDDIPVTDSTSGGISQISGTLYDVQRVEVLKGPQGTLYGEGNMGGALRYVTNTADPQAFDASVTSQLSDSVESDDPSWVVGGMVNVPLIDDKLALRVSGQYRDRAGFLDTFADRNEDDANWVEETGMRARLAWYLSDTVTVDTTVNYFNAEYGGPNLALFPFANPELSNAGFEQLYGNGGEDEQLQYNVSVHWELPFAQFLSSTSYFDRDVEFAEQTAPRFNSQIDSAVSPLLRLPEFAPGVPNPFYLPSFPTSGVALAASGGTGAFRRRSERVVQEFRLVSTNDGPWQWTAGAYFKDDEATNGDKARPAFGIVMNPGFEAFKPVFDGFFPGNETIVSSSELAGYGEVGYAFSEQLDLLVGARVSNVKTDVKGLIPEVDDTLFSPKVTLSFRPMEDRLIYATYSQGFRPGLINSAALTAARNLAPLAGVAPGADAQIAFLNSVSVIDGDEVLNFELGFKGTFLDGRLTVSSALYYMDWKDVILNQRFPTILSPEGITYNQNSGDAHSQGIELEVDFNVTDSLLLHVGGDYNQEAEIETFSQGQFADAQGNPVNILPGNRLANAPKYSFNASLDQGFTVGNFNGSARLDWYRVAESFNRATNEQKTLGYHKLDGRVTLRPQAGGWRVALFATNLADDIIRYETNEVGTGYGPARTIGVEFGWNLN